MNVFNRIPVGFFNCLASGSSNRIYSDCLLLIYHEYDHEITYRMPRNRIRDVLTMYFLENQVELLDEIKETAGLGKQERSGDAGNCSQMANAVIRKFCSAEVGWLEEENDDSTYEKQIIMTEQGVFLAEFLQKLMQPEREEFSSYIFNIYNSLRNREQWEQDPYINVLCSIYRDSKQLSKALKRLATFIKKIIERMVQEESLESLTENILEYCEGDFIREYARLTKQQNIHIYRSYIRTRLEEMQHDSQIFELLVIGCCCQEEIGELEAREMVVERIQAVLQFFSEDYDRIMRDIKHKLNVYLQIAVGRARFLHNRRGDVRGSVEQTIRILAQEMEELGWKEWLPEEMNGMFLLENHEFLDLDSLRYPRKTQSIQKTTYVELEELKQEDIDRARLAQEREADNPYSKEKMQNYIRQVMGERKRISSEELPLQSKRDLLCALSLVAYGQESGYEIHPQEGYVEAQQLMLHRFTIEKIKEVN